MTIIKAEIQHLNDLIPLFDSYRIFYRQRSNLVAAKQFLKARLVKTRHSNLYRLFRRISCRFYAFVP